MGNEFLKPITLKDVDQAATELILRFGSTTSLDTKKRLRDSGFHAVQAEVSSLLSETANKRGWRRVQKGNHLIYSFSVPIHKPVIASLHGIRTRGKWQKDITPLLAKDDMIPFPMDYGWFPAIFFLIPFLRNAKREWFMREYEKMTALFPNVTPSIIAHSLGTLLVARSMDKWDEIKFDKVIFCGAIVRREYPWNNRIRAGRLQGLLNEYGGLDFWARIATYFVSDAGQSGLLGFSERNHQILQRKYREYRHGDFFHRLHFINIWIPFLQNKQLSQQLEEAETPKNWHFLTMLIVVVFGLLPVVLGSIFYHKPSIRSATSTNAAQTVVPTPTPTPSTPSTPSSTPSITPTPTPSPSSTPTPSITPTPITIKPIVFLIDSPTRHKVLQSMLDNINNDGALDVRDRPSHADWLRQCPQLAKEHPILIIAHWHTFREDFASATSPLDRDRKAENELLQGLRSIAEISPKTKFVLYSEAFTKQTAKDSKKVIFDAISRVAKQNETFKEQYNKLAAQIQILPWPDKVTNNDVENLRDAVAKASR